MHKLDNIHNFAKPKKKNEVDLKNKYNSSDILLWEGKNVTCCTIIASLIVLKTYFVVLTNPLIGSKVYTTLTYTY